MKAHLHTIPVTEAFESGDECPFCYLERQAEQSAIRYAAGPAASYMEPEIRAETDQTGFCRIHMQKLFDYGNALGAALMVQSHLITLRENLREEIEGFEAPAKRGLFSKKRPAEENGLPKRILAQVDRCFICERMDATMDRYFQTFFAMIKDGEFRSQVESSKGFCLRHFGELLESAEMYLPGGQREWFYRAVFPLMEENLQRVQEDLDWLVCKYDYRNLNADWKNSKDALQRAMQKIQGIYPADKPYKNE